jgi:aldose 1-epimerase
MTEIISLSAHGFDLFIAPKAGGGIARLDWNGLPLLRPAVSGAVGARDPLGLSCFPMTPYVSRITDGVFSWGDVTTHIAPNMAGAAHPLHGIGWRKPWEIESQSEKQISLVLTHSGDQDWPWAFVTRQVFKIFADHVEHHLSVKNQDQRPFPSSLGPHPYFEAQDAKITFAARTLWEISGESLPTHQARPIVIDHLAIGASASSLDLDHCFEGWNGVATIAWPSHSVRIDATSSLDGEDIACTRLQLYTPKGEDYFCLEPVTARCVAFTTEKPSDHGVVSLGLQELSITTKFTPDAHSKSN